MKKQLLLWSLLGVLLCVFALPITHAQDGQDLPTELYILLNTGEVQQIGLGTAGIRTVSPEGLFILDFAIAPDNRTLTYRTEEGLYLLDMFTEDADPLQLDDTDADIPPLRGRGQTMAWSPIGDAIAYTNTFGARVYFELDDNSTTFTNIPVSALAQLLWSPDGRYLVAEAEGQIWWIYQRDGTAMNLISAIPSSIGVSWLDATRLLFAPADGGLFMMNLANANQQTQLRDTTNLYRLPYARSDGTIGVFTKPADADLVEADEYFYQSLDFGDNVATINRTGEGLVNIQDAHWAPNGDVMLFFQNDNIGLILPEFAVQFQIPVTDSVAFAWGVPRPPSAVGFTMTYSATFLAEDGLGIAQVWHLPRNGLPALQLSTAETDVTAYGVSNDGSTIAYISQNTLFRITLDATGNPTGEAEVWAEVSANSDDIIFTADNLSIIYTDPDTGIMQLALAENTPTILLANEGTSSYQLPRFALTVNALSLTRLSGNTAEQVMFDINSGEIIPLGAYDNGEWLTDGRFLAYNNNANQIDLLDPNTPDADPITGLRSAGSFVIDAIEPQAGTVRILLLNDNPRSQFPLSLIQVLTTASEADEISTLGYLTDPQISPDGAFIAGLTQPNGAFIVYNVEQNQAFTLSTPSRISEFRWSTFR